MQEPAVTATSAADRVDVGAYLAECRELAVEQIRRFVPKDSPFGPILYDLMLEYPLRVAKGLRPALCLACCRALGGNAQAALPSAAIIELYHNAFLVHDDIEDGSALRRDRPTLHRAQGVPIAINVGDGMLALALEPLLQNTQILGVGKALRVMQVVANMARETAEGQAVELDWVAHATWGLSDDDYRQMVAKKTGWYSFIAPIAIGAIVAGASPEQRAILESFARELGVAFQIRDDVLNLCSDERRYGKEACGDLWEGKHTLILIHMLRSATAPERERALGILACSRPALDPTSTARPDAPQLSKTAADLKFLLGRIHAYRSIEYASRIGQEHAARALGHLAEADAFLSRSVHRDLLHELVDFTMRRDR